MQKAIEILDEMMGTKDYYLCRGDTMEELVEKAMKEIKALPKEQSVEHLKNRYSCACFVYEEYLVEGPGIDFEKWLEEQLNR